MSIAVVSLPEKRSNSEYHNLSEKRFQIDDLPTVDSAMKLESDVKAIQYYCIICECKTDHRQFTCPNRSKATGMACSICDEPCEIKEHKDEWKVIFKFCVRCDVTGNHWTKDCPDPIYDDDCVFDDVDEDWY